MSAAAPRALAAPELDFAVEAVEAVGRAAAPTLRFRVRVDAGDAQVRALALNVQVRIAATRRAYADGERERLYELFGEPEGFGRSVRSLLWAHATANVAPFGGETTVDLLVPCTYDLDVVAAKYLQALEDGEVPLELLFSGTVFFPGEGGGLRAAPVPWDREAGCRMPVAVWREALELAFPDTAWIRVGRDTFERLHARRSAGALLTWDALLDELLEAR